MKVLFVQNIEGIAGSEKYFWHLLPALKKSAVEVEFLSVFKPQFKNVTEEFENELSRNNIKTHAIQTNSYLSFGLIRKLKKLIDSEKYDIVHSHLIYADFWSAIIRRLYNPKCVFVSTLHGYQEQIYTRFCLKPEQLPKNKYYFVAKFVYPKLDFVYSCSYGLRDFYLKAGFKFKNKIGTIQHGFDYTEIEPVNMDPNRFLCVIPGRLIERKGHELVLRKCLQLKKEIPDFILQIIGDGPLKEHLHKIVEENGLAEFVTFTGHVSDVRPFLKKANLVLIPSYSEGLPLVIFEAMSVSKPVLAFNTVGVYEAVSEGKTGYLIEPFDENLFAQKIIELSKQRDLLKSVGANAKEIQMLNFSLKRMTEETIQFYQTCLNSRPFLIT